MNVMPTQVSAPGNPGILRHKKLALFCSVKCPGNIILQTYDCMKALRDIGVTVIGGFHSPMEKECLDILSSGKQIIAISNDSNSNLISCGAIPVIPDNFVDLTFFQFHHKITA